MKLLWNLYQYYQQFLPQVEAHIAKLRAPIEKQLKGYVKIARWNDINFWALKEAVTRAHKTLHKHIKDYQAVLSSPVTTILTEPAEAATEAAARKHIDNELFLADEKLKVSSVP